MVVTAEAHSGVLGAAARIVLHGHARSGASDRSSRRCFSPGGKPDSIGSVAMLMRLGAIKTEPMGVHPRAQQFSLAIAPIPP